MQMIIEPPLNTRFSKTLESFHEIMQLQGVVYRQVEKRKTLRFEHQGKGYFAKLHFGIGWPAIIKSLLKFKLPEIGAKPEYQAIQFLEQLNIVTMKIAAYGVQGLNPAKQQSFLITEEISDKIGMNDYCQDWPNNRPPYRLRNAIITKLAEIIRTMHGHGMNHRDCYLCHFYINPQLVEKIDIAVMDLHRAQIRKRVPQRWVIKDLSGLYFSAIDIGLSKKDIIRFVQSYAQEPMRQALLKEKNFWQKVQQRARNMYYREFAKQPKFYF